MASAQLHELYLSFKEAGFTEEEALRLIASVLLAQTPPDSA